jgi:hypothetical protein
MMHDATVTDSVDEPIDGRAPLRRFGRCRRIARGRAFRCRAGYGGIDGNRCRRRLEAALAAAAGDAERNDECANESTARDNSAESTVEEPNQDSPLSIGGEHTRSDSSGDSVAVSDEIRTETL